MPNDKSVNFEVPATFDTMLSPLVHVGQDVKFPLDDDDDTHTEPRVRFRIADISTKNKYFPVDCYLKNHQTRSSQDAPLKHKSMKMDTDRLYESNSHTDTTNWIRHFRKQLRSAYLESTKTLVEAVDARDPNTREHSQTVSKYACEIGRRMKLNETQLESLRAASLLHDVGKIGVPDAILTKPGPLTHDEFETIKRHPVTALEILSPISFLSDERPIILYHHERYDGTGYPAGLCGERIPLGARILSVADALDTMFSPRSYKQPYEVDHVRNELIKESGKQFDPKVVDVTLTLIEEKPEMFDNSSNTQEYKTTSS